jgi:hypothetical protein
MATSNTSPLVFQPKPLAQGLCHQHMLTNDTPNLYVGRPQMLSPVVSAAQKVCKLPWGPITHSMLAVPDLISCSVLNSCSTSHSLTPVTEGFGVVATRLACARPTNVSWNAGNTGGTTAAARLPWTIDIAVRWGTTAAERDAIGLPSCAYCQQQHCHEGQLHDARNVHDYLHTRL